MGASWSRSVRRRALSRRPVVRAHSALLGDGSLGVGRWGRWITRGRALRADSSAEFCAQLLQPSRTRPLTVRERQGEPVRDLVVRQAVEEGELDDLPLGAGQPGERPPEALRLGAGVDLAGT